MNSEKTQIFQTENSKRYNWTKWSFRVIFILAICLAIIVGLTIIRGSNPSMPALKSVENAYKSKLDPQNPFTLETKLNKKYKGFKDFLKEKIENDNKISHPNTKLIRAAFYTPWSSLSLTDLRHNGNKLNTIYPEWFFINPKTYRLDSRIDKNALDVMKHFGLSIQPIFNNFISKPGGQGEFSGQLLHTILHDENLQNQLIQDIITTIKKNNLQGINIDFEEIKENSDVFLTHFQTKLYKEFKKNNLIVSMDIMADNTDYDVVQLQHSVDYFILMAYDQYNDPTNSGPISSQKWIEKQMDLLAEKISPDKIILGIGAYGRKWVKDSD